VLALGGCKRAYEPAVFRSDNNYLVVDGFINIAPGAVSSFILSRTTNVGDSATINHAELHAAMSIRGARGSSYTLAEKGNGVYSSAPISLDNSDQYKVFIQTSDGDTYESDLAPCKQNPPIDSITWKLDNSVTVYVNTHDPTGQAVYYRWSYEDTWEYHSQLTTPWIVIGGIITGSDSSNQTTICWQSNHTSEVLLGTTAALSQDIIYQQPVKIIPHDDERIDYKYSILVKQYALTQEAYNYWQIIQKNTQQTGTLFDLLPSQLEGNIHSLKFSGEPVIGYISATVEQQKRIFITHTSLGVQWQSNPPGYSCPILNIPRDPRGFEYWTYPDSSFAPYYFVTGDGIMITKKNCLDCTLRGGINHQPPFWQ